MPLTPSSRSLSDFTVSRISVFKGSGATSGASYAGEFANKLHMIERVTLSDGFAIRQLAIHKHTSLYIASLTWALNL